MKRNIRERCGSSYIDSDSFYAHKFEITVLLTYVTLEMVREVNDLST